MYPIRKLWSWMPMGGITIFGSIFVKDLNDWLTIGHEKVHERQQKAMGFKFWFLYIFWPPSRARLEAEAYAIQALAGCPIDGDNGLAASLSSFLYLFCCSRDKASKLIKEYVEAWK